MVYRIWHGYTTPENANAYEAFLQDEVYAEIKGKNIDGFKGLQLLKTVRAEEVEFMTIMTFDSYEAVQQFAGKNYENAYVPDAARRLLSRFDDKAMHYQLVLQLE